MNKEQEVIDILEQNMSFMQEGIEHLQLSEVLQVVEKNTKQVLVLLKPCETCNDKIPDFCSNPKHFKPAEKPASEFTKELRKLLDRQMTTLLLKRIYTKSREACVRLDKAEADKESIQKLYDNTMESLFSAERRIKELTEELDAECRVSQMLLVDKKKQDQRIKEFRTELQEIANQMMEEYEKRESPENAEFLGWHTRIVKVLSKKPEQKDFDNPNKE